MCDVCSDVDARRFRGDQELCTVMTAHMGAVSRFVVSTSMYLHSPHIDMGSYGTIELHNHKQSPVQFQWENVQLPN